MIAHVIQRMLAETVAVVLLLSPDSIPASEAQRLAEQPANLLWISDPRQNCPIHTQAACCMPI